MLFLYHNYDHCYTIIVIGSEESQLLRTQQQDLATFHHHTIAVHINLLAIQTGIGAENCPGCLLWLVSEACQTSMSAQVVFK